MKKVLLLIVSLLTAAASFAQPLAGQDYSKDEVEAIYVNYLMMELTSLVYNDRDYKGALESGSKFLEWWESVPVEMKADVPFRFYIYTCMAEAAARDGRTGEALEYTRQAVGNGCDSFTYVLDLMAIPELETYPGFREAIAPLREIDGDYIGLLREEDDYRSEPAPAEELRFGYSGPYFSPFRRMLEYFDLDTIAGDGDELDRIVNVMDWVHDNIPHNGASSYGGEPNLHSLFHYSKATGSGVNCRMLATALNECYLALGYKSRLVSCLPANEDDMDSHIINAVWSDGLGKWLWMDPTYSAYVTDGAGNLLGIGEVRQRLIDGEPVEVRPGANWNHLNDITSEFYLYNYMAKNLYILECWQQQSYNTESVARENRPVYIQLRPYGSQSWLNSGKIATSDPQLFWQKPD